MNARTTLIHWLRRDPVLAIALALAGISLFFVPFSWQALIQCIDWKVLSILACLMLVVAALREEAVLQAAASVCTPPGGCGYACAPWCSFPPCS